MDLSAFYFPYEKLEEGLVYEYEQVGIDSSSSEYWLLQSVKEVDSWHLIGKYYDPGYNLRQHYRQEIFENGTLIKDYSLFTLDSLGQEVRVDASIKHPNAFPFHLKDSTSILVTEMSWLFSEFPKHRTTIVRNRQYEGRVQFKFEGELKEAIRFNLKELVDDETIGHLETAYNAFEIYAMDIGLVYYYKEVGESITEQFQLKEIHSLSNFEGLIK